MMREFPKGRVAKIILSLAEAKGALTAKMLSSYVESSPHTVRNDMQEVREWMNRNGGTLIVKPRVGYCLEIGDVEIWQPFIQGLRERARRGGNTSQKERMKYILTKVLLFALHQKSMNQWDLAENLFIGLTTLKSYWKEMEDSLARYGLRLKSDKAGKIRIEGGEEKIRKAIADMLFANMEINGHGNEFYDNVFSVHEIESVKKIVLDNVLRYNFPLSDIAFQSIVIHILIILRRVEAKATVEYSAEEASFLQSTASFRIAQHIVASLREELDIDIGNEVYYIAQHLVASERFFAKEDVNQSETRRLVAVILGKINDEYHVDFQQDDTLLTGLQIHIEAALHRLRFNIGVRNEILQAIKKDFPLAFEFAVIASCIIESRESIKTNENEIGFLAVHFGAAMERMKVQKKSCILVCDTGRTMSLFMKERIIRRFGGYINITRVCHRYALTVEEAGACDLIISTIPLPELEKMVNSSKVIYVQPAVDADDIHTLEKVIFGRQKEQQLTGKEDDFFHRDLFFPHMKAKSKEDVLEQITGKMLELGYIDETIKASIFEREKMSSTAIGSLIAMPHALDSSAVNPAIAVSILDAPVIWGQERVQIVFCLSIPKRKVRLWEDIFYKIYDYLVQGFGAQELFDNPDYDLLLERIAK